MRSLQFWVLMVCSCFTCFLYFRQISLGREIDLQQRVVVDSQEAVSEGDAYENAWKQLAMSVYQNGKNDPALLDILKKENVDVRAGAPPPAASTLPGTTSALPSVPPKASAAPAHPTP